MEILGLNTLRKLFQQQGLIEKTGFSFDFDLSDGDVWIALLTFLYIDLVSCCHVCTDLGFLVLTLFCFQLDTTGTLYSMAKFAGFLRPDGSFEGEKATFTCDALATTAGALMGTSPVTTVIGKVPLVL